MEPVVAITRGPLARLPLEETYVDFVVVTCHSAGQRQRLHSLVEEVIPLDETVLFGRGIVHLVMISMLGIGCRESDTGEGSEDESLEHINDVVVCLIY